MGRSRRTRQRGQRPKCLVLGARATGVLCSSRAKGVSFHRAGKEGPMRVCSSAATDQSPAPPQRTSHRVHTTDNLPSMCAQGRANGREREEGAQASDFPSSAAPGAVFPPPHNMLVDASLVRRCPCCRLHWRRELTFEPQSACALGAPERGLEDGPSHLA